MSDFAQPADRVEDQPIRSHPLALEPSVPSLASPGTVREPGVGARQSGVLRFPHLQQTRIRRSGTAVIRRQIDDVTWQRRVQPVLRQGRTVTVTDGATTKSLFFEKKKLYLFTGSTGTKIEVTGQTVAAMRAAHDVVPDTLPDHLTKAVTKDLTVAPGDGFKVTELAGEPLSFVHHTASSDGTNSHLTMENAHAVALYDATSSTWEDVRSKVGEDKKTINNRLGIDYRIPAIDNLNFYPREKPAGSKKKQGASQPLHEDLSLDGYLQFVVRAFDRCGVRREYGERMVQMAQTMAAKKALDLTSVFMRVGMDESSFIRAVLAIEGRIVASGATGLVLAAEHRDPFAKWWNSTDNEDGVPYLHDLAQDGTPDATKPPALAARPWVREGTTAPSGTSYSSLETAYTRAHVSAYIAAVNTWTALQPAPL